MSHGQVASAQSQVPADLSRRQKEVLTLLADGVPARTIALRLGLAEATVRNHIRLVLRKLDCHSQLEAVAVAFRLGLLRLEPPSREEEIRAAIEKRTDVQGDAVSTMVVAP